MTGHDVDGVNPHHLRVLLKARQEQAGGIGHPPESVPVERVFGLGHRRAGLHLHEGQYLALTGDQIDLSDPRLEATAENAPALAAEVKGRERLRPAAAAFRFSAVNAGQGLPRSKRG